MRTKIWMTPWEMLGKALVILLVAFTFTRFAPIPTADGGTTNPALAMFAFTALFVFCLALYELVGRAIGMLAEKMLGRDAPPPPFSAE